MKRMLLTLLAAFGLVVPALRAQDAWDGTTVDISWYDPAAAGTTAYDISTPAQLAGLAELVNAGNTFEGKTITLTASIDLGNKEWTPIGNGTRSKDSYAGTAFKGTFQAGLYSSTVKTISNLNISTGATEAAIGLFGVVDGGTVQNLKLANVAIDVASEQVGGAVGLMVANATVQSVTLQSGTLKGAEGTGGIVGRLIRQGTIKSCYNNGATVTATVKNAGGIVGAAYYNNDGMAITSCTNKGNVTGPTGVGGIVGFSVADVTSCTNEGAVVGNGTSVGGIVGEQQNTGSVSKCTNKADVKNSSASYGVGGIVGWVRYSGAKSSYPTKTIISVTGNTNTGSVSGGNDAGGIVGTLYHAGVVTDNVNKAPSLSAKTFAGGIVGNIQYTEKIPEDDPAYSFYTETGDVRLSHNNTYTTLENISAQNANLFAYDNDAKQGSVVEENLTGEWGMVADTSWYDSATADTTTSYEISTAAELAGLAKLVNEGNTFQGKTITLSANIDLGEKLWTPIGTKDNSFQGTFDGDGKTISNLTITGSKSYVGFFGKTVGATLRNLTVENVNVSGFQYVAGLSGHAYTGTVENCHVTGSIAISGSYKYVGGITGSSYATIRNCSVKATTPEQGTISGTSDNVGGMIGYRAETSGVTENCSVSNVKVSGLREVGGLAGAGYMDNRYMNCAVDNVTVVCTATSVSSSYASSYGYGGLVGALNNGKGQYKGGTFKNCVVEGVTLVIPEAIKDEVSAGYVTGGVRDGGANPPRDFTDAENFSADIIIAGENTGANTGYLADVPACVYPTEKFDSASAFIKSFTEGKTVYDGETHHATMVEALQAIHKNGKTTLWCKPGADVGAMTHGHVCQSLTVYGNGATVTGGEHDFELDTYWTGNQLDTKYGDCSGITGEVTLEIHALNEVAVWGERKTAHTLNISLTDCKDINRVYITGTKGTNNITLTNCTASEKSRSCTVYSNAPGEIIVEDCTFTSVAQPICLNNNSGATQNVTVKGCTFTDCGTGATLPNLTSSVEVWASPIRVLTTVEGSVTNLRVEASAFAYVEGAIKCNGDILLGNGAENGKSFPTVTATIVNTAAEVQVQQPGDHPKGVVSANPTKRVNVEASDTATVIKNTLPVAVVDGMAYDTLLEVMTAIQSKVEAGATAVAVKLLSDVSAGNTKFSIPNGLALTLDLNGKTYTYTPSTNSLANYAFYLEATSTLTVTDSSTDQTGTMKAAGTAQGCLNNNGGTLNVLGGRFVQESTSSSYAIISGGVCVLEPEGKQTIALTGGLSLRMMNGIGTARIAGDTTITGKDRYYAIYVGNGANGVSVEIEGGTFKSGSLNSAICVDGGSAATVDISGGKFTGKFGGNGTGTYTLSGGSYSVDPSTTASPSKVTLAPNLFAVQNAESYYDVGPFVVEITEGEAKGGYATLQDAVDVVSALDPAPESLPTITLLRDVVLEDAVTLTKDISIDLAGHTLYAKDGGTLAFSSENTEGVTVSFTENDGSFVSAAQAKADNSSNVTINGITTKAPTKWTNDGAYDISWYESGKTEYTLTTAAQVAGIAKMIERIEAAALENEEEADRFSTVTFTLGADIDLSALEWVSKAFDGVLDGNGHTIKGVRVSGTSTRGFFSTLGGTVKGIRFTDASISVAPSSADSKQRYGGVVAAKLNGGTIANCVVEGSKITATGMATKEGLGALVGTGSGTIKDCLVSGVTFVGSTEGSTTTGSFVGAGSTTITNCYVDGVLTQTSGTLTNVYAKDTNNRFVRHNTVDGALPPETLGVGAALNGIGWLLNGQKTEDTTAWRVDSNEDCTTLLPFRADGVEVIPDVERRLTKSESIVPFPEGGYWYGYFANGYAATVKLNAEGKTVLTTTRDDYLVDEELELKANWAGSIDGQVAVFGGCNGGTLNDSTHLTIEATKGTLKRVFGGSYSADATTSSITGTATLTITGGTVEKAYGGSCGDASEVANAKLTLNGGTVTTAIATSNGGKITGTATLEVASGATTAAKLVAMERGTAQNVTFSMRGVATGGICLSADSATAEASVTGTVELYNRVADQGRAYLGAALAKIAMVKLRTSSSSSPITVLAQTAAKDKAETVTIPEGQTVQIQSNVTLQVPADVTLKVAGTVNISGSLVGTSGTSLLEVLEGATVPSSLPQGLSSWDVLTSKWVQAQIEASNGTYYGSVAQALATLAAGDTVTLLSRGVATENVLATSAGKTVYSGDAYDVADVLGGVFTVTVENNTPRLVYAYDLGVGGLTIRKATADEATGEMKEGDFVVEVTVKLAEGGAAPAGTRTLEGCTLTVTSILNKDEAQKQAFTLTKGLTFTEGECKVIIPYTETNFPMGTSHLTVSVSKGEATPPAAEGGE